MGGQVMDKITKKQLSELATCGIGSTELVELMEAAWWAIAIQRVRAGEHLDLNDKYLDELEEKVHKFMNFDRMEDE